MEESLKDSTQIPLLEPPVVQKPKPLYWNTNIFDNYLFFWVNKFVNVPNCLFLSYLNKFIVG